MDILNEIKNIGIIPVVSINDADKAVPLAKALLDGGIAAAEVTFRTSAAEQAIKNISKAFPDMAVGAGTVLTTEQAERAAAAGAKFIVSPGFNPKIVSWCTERNIAVLPGCTTPSEIEQALELGLNTVKFFPAEQSGGLAKIRALSAPYINMNFMPTGGINLNNMNEYLGFKRIIACGGSFMVKGEFIENDNWSEVTRITREAVKTMLGLTIAHIGINSQDEKTALDTAHLLSLALDTNLERDNEKSVFVGSEFEIMKYMGFGKFGHIAIASNSVDRAVYYLSRRGIEFDMDTAAYNDDGSMKFVYLTNDFGGFKIHLIQK